MKQAYCVFTVTKRIIWMEYDADGINVNRMGTGTEAVGMGGDRME